MGNRQTDIRSGVVKQRLKPDGTPVGDVLKNDPWIQNGLVSADRGSRKLGWHPVRVLFEATKSGFPQRHAQAELIPEHATGVFCWKSFVGCANRGPQDWVQQRAAWIRLSEAIAKLASWMRLNECHPLVKIEERCIVTCGVCADLQRSLPRSNPSIRNGTGNATCGETSLEMTWFLCGLLGWCIHCFSYLFLCLFVSLFRSFVFLSFFVFLFMNLFLSVIKCLH